MTFFQLFSFIIGFGFFLAGIYFFKTVKIWATSAILIGTFLLYQTILELNSKGVQGTNYGTMINNDLGFLIENMVHKNNKQPQ